jgi:hypothetical protein
LAAKGRPRAEAEQPRSAADGVMGCLNAGGQRPFFLKTRARRQMISLMGGEREVFFLSEAKVSEEKLTS